MKTLNLVMALRMMKSVRLHCLKNIKLKGLKMMNPASMERTSMENLLQQKTQNR